MHEAVHDEGGSGHVAGVLHERDEEIEYQNLWQEHDDRAHTADDTVDQHGTHGTFGQRSTDEVAKPCHAHFYPVHRVLAQHKRDVEHQEQQGKEYGEAQPAIRKHAVDEVCGAVGVFLRAGLETSLCQGTIDEAILRIHDGGFGIHQCLLQHAGSSLVASGHQLLAVLGTLLVGHVLGYVLLGVGVVLQQLDSQIARGVAQADVFVGLQETLYLPDAVLNLVAVVDVQVAGLAALALVHLDDSAEEFLHAGAVLERRGHHRHTEERAQRLQVDMIAAALELVEHVQGSHQRDVHVDQLRGEVKVALEVGGVDDVDDHVGHFLREMLPDIEFLGRIARQRVGAGQVDKVEVVAEERGAGFGGIDGHARIVAHAGMGTAGIVEERRLAAVGVAHQCHIDDTALAQGPVLQVVVLMLRTRKHQSLAARRVLLLATAELFFRDNFYHLGLLPAQRDFVAHDFIFHGVLQRSIQQHFHLLSLHETHFDDALAESAVARHLYDDGLLASLQF